MADQVDLSRRNSSSNMSDYDFCEEFDDLCDEFDDIEIISYSNESVKTTHKSDFSDKLSGTVSGYFTEFNGNKSFITLSDVDISYPDNILSFLPIKVSIKSSCNGLLLCYGRDYCYYICNPATSEWKKLPLPTCQHGEDPAIVLAFLSNKAHYQLVCAVPDDVENPNYFQFETYFSETNTWKCAKEAFTGLKGVRIRSKGYAFNGVVYWETESDVVLGFDLKNEIPRVLYLKGLDDFVRARCIGSIARVKGEMCYLWASKFAGNIFTFVETILLVESMNSCRRPIMMNGEAFDIGKYELSEPCRVLPCVDEDNTMILIGDVIYACSFYVNKRFKVVSRGCEFALGTKFFPYVNTLVSV